MTEGLHLVDYINADTTSDELREIIDDLTPGVLFNIGLLTEGLLALAVLDDTIVDGSIIDFILNDRGDTETFINTLKTLGVLNDHEHVVGRYEIDQLVVSKLRQIMSNTALS